MVKQKPIMLSATALVAAFVLACNIEVGNPDTGDAPASLMSSVNMRMTQYGDCGTGCNSIPVNVGAGNTLLTFNLTSAKLQLTQVVLEPAATQNFKVNLNLIQAPQVVLPEAVNPAQITAVGLLFSTNTNADSWLVSGRLTGSIDGNSVSMPLTIAGTGDIAGTVAMPSSGLDAIEFDPAIWFDFSGDTSILQALRALERGDCTNLASHQCIAIQSRLSKKIEQSIAKSMRSVAKSEKANGHTK